MTHIRHRHINHFLSGIVLLIGLYIILTPFLPQLSFWWGSVLYAPPPYVAAAETQSDDIYHELPADNTLIIPKMQLEEVIHEGQDASTLQRGAWRRPHTSTPDEGGNTVIAAHRFTYGGPATFYHLDKLQRGDQFTVYWEKKAYTYEVDTVKVVGPDDTAVESNTKAHRLTLYTCTPLWSAENRLVVVASRIRSSL